MQHPDIIYGIFVTPIGEMVLAKSAKGVVFLGFTGDGSKGEAVERIITDFGAGNVTRDDSALRDLCDAVLSAWDGDDLGNLDLDLRGTAFQKRVWDALLEIPRGEVCSYADVAVKIGKPSASRAVGSAVGANPISLLVPCHRVVRGDGGIGGYAWGVERKKLILALEAA